MQGQIFNIQRFSINDGQGIRTAVFFKGCPLRCLWCHNPESQKFSPELLFSGDKCIYCKKCGAVCENGVHSFGDTHSLSREKCIACGKCIEVCPVKCLSIAGNTVSADEVIKEVLRDKIFFDESGGGITLTGGEPFLQYDFMLEILKKAKESALNTAVETCGFTDTEKILSAAEYIDVFLFDYKLTSSALHKKYTGVGNEKILENLKALNDNGSKIVLRCPVIPSVNDTEEHFKGIGETAEALENITGIEVAPYHELGLSKLTRLGRENENPFTVPDKAAAGAYIDEIQQYTSKPVRLM
ncbi:MAG: glycyl-radical enzyme activating protein [Clostridia bacterium]|nr:glycyl-radical enzyme activating protein [Clostridia bacterium]